MSGPAVMMKPRDERQGEKALDIVQRRHTPGSVEEVVIVAVEGSNS